MARIIIFMVIMFPMFLLSGCSDTGTPKTTMEQRLQQQYAQQDRIQKYYELKERYDSRLVLWLNREEDRWWITNFTAWFATIIFDIPEFAGIGAVLGIIYVVAWFIGVTLTGGGILAVLAYIGGLLGGIPGIPPAIAGIIFIAFIGHIAFQLSSWILGG